MMTAASVVPRAGGMLETTACDSVVCPKCMLALCPQLPKFLEFLECSEPGECLLLEPLVTGSQFLKSIQSHKAKGAFCYS